MFRKAVFAAALIAAALSANFAPPAFADNPKLVFAPPGVPPIFVSILAYVAQDQGFFKKYGVDVELRPFDNGTAAARAVVAGDIDAAMTATALLISQIANADVPLVGIYGFPKPDFELVTTNLQKANCTDAKGQEIGVDSIGGARAIALKAILASCQLTLDDVQQVALGSNTSQGLLAGQITYGILHLDDVSDLESHGKKVKVIQTVRDASPTSQNLTLVVRKDNLAAHRDAFVRMVAGLIAAARYMQNPANADHIATVAAVTGRSHAIALSALKDFVKYGLWAVKDEGMDQQKTETFIQTQVKVGNIMDGKTPPTFDQMVDPSVWRDANALVGK